MERSIRRSTRQEENREVLKEADMADVYRSVCLLAPKLTSSHYSMCRNRRKNYIWEKKTEKKEICKM